MEDKQFSKQNKSITMTKNIDDLLASDQIEEFCRTKEYTIRLTSKEIAKINLSVTNREYERFEDFIMNLIRKDKRHWLLRSGSIVLFVLFFISSIILAMIRFDNDIAWLEVALAVCFIASVFLTANLFSSRFSMLSKVLDDYHDCGFYHIVKAQFNEFCDIYFTQASLDNYNGKSITEQLTYKYVHGYGLTDVLCAIAEDRILGVTFHSDYCTFAVKSDHNFDLNVEMSYNKFTGEEYKGVIRIDVIARQVSFYYTDKIPYDVMFTNIQAQDIKSKEEEE